MGKKISGTLTARNRAAPRCGADKCKLDYRPFELVGAIGDRMRKGRRVERTGGG